MKKFYRQLYRQRYLILMMLPGLLWFLIFKYCTYAGLGLAFTNYGFKKSVDFVGLRNFNRLFKSAQFWTAFKNTMIISICNIVFYFPFPIIIALLINELRSEKNIIVLGDGAQICYNGLTEEGIQARMLPDGQRFPRASGVARAARRIPGGPPEELQVQYLRLPQAERERLERLRKSGQVNHTG